jgi:S-DNA-T family DNA segregation ATPase FtsK/SpoIIIE
MNVADLIGKVVTLYLEDELAEGGSAGSAEGTARYIIDCLTAEQTAAIAREILGSASLAAKVTLKLPAHFLGGQGLPEEVLTTYPATYFRNATLEKPVLLVANTGDDEEQSLKEFIRIGAPELQEHPGLWVRVAGNGLNLSESHARWWEKAISGLQDLRIVSLERLAGYILRTREAVLSDGLPVLTALGAALPALRFPRDRVFSNRVKEASRGHTSAWKAQYNFVARNRGCYLLKQTPAQLFLGEEELRNAFDRAKETIPEGHHPTIQAFIQAPSGWNDAAAGLSECEWEEVKALFDGVKREKFNLATETVHFFDEREPELLTVEERDYLKLLVARSTTEATEEDNGFYEAHRNELKEDRKLKSAWDRFVFGKPREAEDFLAGLAASMESLFNQGEAGAKRRLKIRCDRATKRDLRELNVDAGLHFAKRYAGLRALFGDRVSWNVGELFNFPALVETWRTQGRGPLNHSMAKAALQLKFVLELEVELTAGGSQSYTTQLVWKFNPNTVASEFAEDWSRLEEHPLVFCRASRESLGAKARAKTVDLSDVRTFVPAFGRDRGSFVALYRKNQDIALAWRSNLKEARTARFVTDAVAAELEAKFSAFETAYSEAIAGFRTAGPGQEAALKQLGAYADLLDTLARRAKGDRNRELLLRPLLQVGCVPIDGGPPAAIVTPWHPLRLAAIHRKAHLVANLVRRLLTADEVFFGDTRLFFKDLAQELAHPFYPEAVLGFQENRPELLVLTDCVGDYTLHESPVLGAEGEGDTNENPTDGSTCVKELVQRYLALHPHEQANMSVVLYNCDSARLPQAVVDRLGQVYEDEEDVRCQVLLRHSDAARLRDLYKAIVETSDSDADAFNASEATQDFMARLRICIIADQAPPPDPKDGCPFDIVFSQDVIARHAHVEWFPESAPPIDLDRLVPARWSRRRPAARDDMKSVVYLCCPVQSREGWAYLTALTTFIKGDWDEVEEKRLLPARQLDFRDPRTARIFEETHNLGNWVVNYDELLDRRQLLNQSVRVIRYKQSATQGRNIVISSNAPLGLLASMVLLRVKALNLGLSDDEERALARRFIEDANDVSGDIVLRAAKRGRNASELMGIVLSRYLLRNELGADRLYGWYFLDDYADWLGQKEEQIADVLALSPELTAQGQLRLTVFITESKYIDSAAVAAKRKESQKQLRDTMKRINEAVFGSPERLDRELWLARLSDLILDGVQFPASSRLNLSDWRRAIREGACEIAVRGYSHVFVSDPTDAAECSAFCRVTDLDEGFQEVFGRSDLRELALAYFRGEDPLKVRRRVAGEDIWGGLTFRRPTDRAPLAPSKKRGRKGGGDDGGTSPGLPPDPPPDRPDAPAPSAVGPDEEPGDPKKDGADEKTPAREKPQPASQHTEPSGWAYPAVRDLLREGASPEDSAGVKEWLRQTEATAKHALQQFHLQARLLQSTLTPNCALLKFAGSANLTVEQLNRRRSELLTTYGLNVISVRPEPGAVTAAVARPTREVIRTEEVWSRWQPSGEWGNEELLVGVREDDGKLLLLAPGTRHAPHTLVAGSTGSGKSVLMQNLILAVAATNTPRQARIVLIDPKQGVDYFAFEELPHLDGRLIVEQEEASARLDALVAEMDSRYSRLRAARVQNLSAFNRKVPEPERLPVIWVVHDEFAEWMLVEDYKEQVTATVARLGVKARAAGIHLVFAAQRPDANVMPMQLRANLGNRLILKVDSEGTSEIALGEPGAERLLGHGHLIAKLEGSPGLNFVQVPLIEPDFIERAVRAMHEDAPSGRGKGG